MSERPVLICGAVRGPDDDVVPGSEIRWCEICAEEIWVSPTGLTFVADHDDKVQLVCLDCAMGLPGHEEADVTPCPGAVEDMRAEGIPEEVIRATGEIVRRALRGGNP